MPKRGGGVTSLINDGRVKRVRIVGLEYIAAATFSNFLAVCDLRWAVNAQAVSGYSMRLHHVLDIIHSVFNSLHPLVRLHADRQILSLHGGHQVAKMLRQRRVSSNQLLLPILRAEKFLRFCKSCLGLATETLRVGLSRVRTEHAVELRKKLFHALQAATYFR